jgi:predicted RNA-binding protein (virulence factor B family)
MQHWQLMGSMMVEVGKLNRLKVAKEVDFGLYLDGGDKGEILLPVRYVPENCAVGDEIEVFIYRDSEDRIIATTEKPYVMVGGFACLKVVSVTGNGAFLDWGLSKDLLVPYSEMEHKMEEDKRYVIGVYLDENTDRIVGSAKLDDFLYDESEDEFKVGEEVDLFVANKSDLGYKLIVNESHWGLLHNQEAVRDLKRGENLKGFIKNIRPDGKIDLCLRMLPSEKTGDVSDMILKLLRKEGGFITVTDKSSPEEIRALFGISKGNFKKAVGALYKKRIIIIEEGGIRLNDVWATKKRKE